MLFYFSHIFIEFQFDCQFILLLLTFFYFIVNFILSRVI